MRFDTEYNLQIVVFVINTKIMTFIDNLFSPFWCVDILSADRQLAKEIEFDMKKFERDDEEKQRNEAVTVHKDRVSGTK